jgi:hypothetical protein
VALGAGWLGRIARHERWLADSLDVAKVAFPRAWDEQR